MKQKKKFESFIETQSDLDLQNYQRFQMYAKGDNDTTNNSSNSSNGTGQTKDEILNEKQETYKEGKKESKSYQIKTTRDAYEAIKVLYTPEDKYLKKQIKLMQDTHNLASRVLKSANPLLKNDISGYVLQKRIRISDTHFSGTDAYLRKLINEGTTRLKNTFRKYQLKLLEKFKLLRWKPFKEEYHFQFQDIWEVYDNPQAQAGPSVWQYTDQNLAGKVQGISQLSNIQSCAKTECQGTATMILLKYRDWYDVKITTSMLMRDSDIVGIVFGARDPFNYYVFEMSSKQKFKRIRRIMHGSSHILTSVEDGGYLQNVWYKVILTVQKGIFTVKMGEESQGTQENQLKIVIEGEDQAFSRGQFGFLTNGMSGLYISDFQAKTKQCSQPETIAQGIVYRSPTCSRYNENFFGDISLRYSIVEPPNMNNGPSQWAFKKNFAQRNKVIYQSSTVFSQHQDKIPSILILEYQQFIKDGYMMIEFYPQKEGIVGIVFRYVNPKNYYILEIAGQQLQFIRIRKQVDGVWTLLEELQKSGYELEKWYKIQMFIEDNSFKVYFNQMGESDTIVFDPPVLDDTFKEGQIGLSTYLTPAAFGVVKIMPVSDLYTEQTPEEVKQSKGASDFQDDIQQQAVAQVESKIYHNNNDKTIDYKVCLQNNSPFQRAKQCESMFQMDKFAKQNCETNYCQICCENNIDWLHKNARFTCQRQCQDLSSEEEVDVYKSCVETTNPEKSIFNYCQTQFQQKADVDQCKNDFCELCCVTSSQINNLLVPQKSIDSCNKKCQNSFGPKDE